MFAVTQSVSISLKKSDDVPVIYELWGMSEDEFYNQIGNITQINNQR